MQESITMGSEEEYKTSWKTCSNFKQKPWGSEIQWNAIGSVNGKCLKIKKMCIFLAQVNTQPDPARRSECLQAVATRKTGRGGGVLWGAATSTCGRPF